MKNDRKKRIVVIDDDESIQQVVKMILDRSGYETMLYSTAEPILNGKVDLPDLILIDALLPGIDGREVCRDLKNSLITKHVPIVLLSATYDLAQKAKEVGADGFIEKPFKMSELREKIQSLVE